MERIKAILANESYRRYVEQIENYEKDRRYCRHGQDHFLAVCRISYILVLEEPDLAEVCRKIELGKLLGGGDEGTAVQPPQLAGNKYRQEEARRAVKELVYAAGLLHDIGRWLEYETGEDHALVSGKLAVPILMESGFLDNEISLIVAAIREHRGTEEKKSYLGMVIARADNLARGCVLCQTKDGCYKVEKMLKQYGKIIY
jgi:hypothetical protein